MFDYLSSGNFVVDWFSGVIPCDDVNQFVNAFCKVIDSKSTDFVVAQFGFKNYKTCINFHGENSCFIAYNECVEGVCYKNIFWDGLNSLNAFYVGKEKYKPLKVFNGFLSGTALMNSFNPGIYISFSGSFCSWLRENNYFDKVICLLKSYDFKASRIDIALDIFKRDNDIIPLISECWSNFYYKPGSASFRSSVNRFKNGELIDCGIEYVNRYPDNDISYNYQLGTHSLTCMMRVYDKYYKSVYVDKSSLTDIDYWYRVEFESHSRQARKVFDILTGSNNYNVPNAFLYLMKHVYCPVTGEYTNLADCDLHPLFIEFEEWITSQNSYFVSFEGSVSISKDSNVVHYVRSNVKTFANAFKLIHQLIASADEDNISFVGDWLRDGFIRSSGCSDFLVSEDFNIDEFVNAFITFSADYINSHPFDFPLFNEKNIKLFRSV